VELGTVLKQMRKEAGLSQEAISEELHIARSSISKLERDQLELRAFDLIRWANVTQSQEALAAMILGVDVATLQQALDTVSTTIGLILGGVL